MAAKSYNVRISVNGISKDFFVASSSKNDIVTQDREEAHTFKGRTNAEDMAKAYRDSLELLDVKCSVIVEQAS